MQSVQLVSSDNLVYEPQTFITYTTPYFAVILLYQAVY